jgi:hypothetical protein
MFNYFGDTTTHVWMIKCILMDGWKIISFATLLQLSLNSTKQLICDFVFIHMIYVNIYAKLW